MFPDHPLGREVLGDPEVIRNVTVPAIRSFFDEHYLPGNMVIAAAGDLDHERLALGIEARFAGRHGGRPPVRRPPARRRRARRRVAGDRAGPARPRLQGAGPAFGRPFRTRRAQPHPRRGALQPALPGDPRSPRPRLLDRVRPQRLRRRRDAAISVGTSPEHAHEVLDLLHTEVDRLGADGITAPGARGGQGPPARRHAPFARGLRVPHGEDRLRPVAVRLRAHDRGVARTHRGGGGGRGSRRCRKGADGPSFLAVVGPFSESDFS